jgi:hypothetical protein
MCNETLRCKLFSFSLTGKAKHWYNRHVGSTQGDWEVLCSNFCLQFFSIFKVAKLRREIICFEQQKKESLGEAWECFDAIVNSGPSLAFPEPMLLQYFFIGLNRKTKKYLNLASGGAFMHITVERAKTILMNILNDLPEEKLLEEEEISIAESELLPETSQLLAIVEPELPQKKEEEFSLPDFLFDIEDDKETSAA